MDILNDEWYMRLALDMARRAEGQTGVNPVVGCVVVNGGRVVGLGAHLKRGEAHAEVHALNMAGGSAAGATVYVTLEPCSHHGRTPPCCDRLIADRVARVVVAAEDPNPRVAGSGIARLREAGIDVSVGLLADEARALNEPFNKWIATGLPFVTLKTAMTLDGRIAARGGASKWITGPDAREAVHTMRHRSDGIMVGIGTIVADDPELTTRLTVPGLHPVRIVVDSRLRLPDSARVLNGEAPTIVLTTERADPARERALRDRGAEVLRAGSGDAVDLPAAMRELGGRDIGSILLEGGGVLNGAMLAAGLVDKLALFYAPLIVGAAGAPSAFEFEGPQRLADAFRLEGVTLERFGPDWCVTGYPAGRREPVL